MTRKDFLVAVLTSIVGIKNWKRIQELTRPKRRILKGNWKFEISNGLRAIHGLEAEEELIAMVRSCIPDLIAHEILGFPIPASLEKQKKELDVMMKSWNT